MRRRRQLQSQAQTSAPQIPRPTSEDKGEALAGAEGQVAGEPSDPIRLLNDQALGEEGGRDADGLNFQTYASVLARVAKGTPGPFTIGVFGDWGTGKTSLMRLTKMELDHDENTITVWFNAWRYENIDHPIVPLTATSIRRLQQKADMLNNQGLKDGGKKLRLMF